MLPQARWAAAARWLSLLAALACEGAQVHAQSPSDTPQPVSAESRPAAVEGPRLPDVFEDFSQVEQVAADTTRAILKRFHAENPSPRQVVVKQKSQGFEQNDSRPALALEQMWVGDKGVLLELKGLPRRLNTASAVMRRDTLRVRTAKGDIKELIAFEGVTELRDKRGGSALVVAPGDSLYLLYDKFDDYFGFSLYHQNRDGKESIYFDAVDPRFRERYDAMHAAATTPLGMKDFLVEFANNDPDKRVMPIFAKFLGEMRRVNTFEGYHGAFQLIGDPKDYEAMRRTATTDQHRSVIRGIEEEKLAEVRRKEEARAAEARRQEAARMEQQRIAEARAAEQRCLVTPSCLAELEARREACTSKVMACRRQCDSLTSGGKGIFGFLASAVLYRGCASQCKCEAGFGDLLAKMNQLESGQSTSRSDDRRPSASNTSAANTTAANTKPTAAPAREATGPKLFACKIYCNSSSGPIITRETQAGSREEAAKILGEKADQLCRVSGHPKASSLALPASQCWGK